MGDVFVFKEGIFPNKYLEKHLNVDLAKCSFGEFVGANRDKIEPRRNILNDWEYLLSDRKFIFYYDYFCSGEIVESLKSSERGEAILGVSDLSWFFGEFKKKYSENLRRD